MSLMKNKNKVHPSTLPCGMPQQARIQGGAIAPHPKAIESYTKNEPK